MHVILLAFHYPPDPAVGSFRPAKVVRALRAAGHTVTVITARLPGEMKEIRHAEAGLQVHAVEPQSNPREWYAALKERWKTKRVDRTLSPRPAADQSYAIPTRVPLWKRAIFSLLLLPDHRQGYIYPAIKAASPLLMNRDSMLYTTAPPFSVHLAGWWLSRRTRVPWAAEFRDPWTDSPWKPWHVRTSFSDRIERWMEQKVVSRASIVIAVSRGIDRCLRRKMVDLEHRLTIIRNGIDTLDALPAERPSIDRPFRIVHIGSFYQGRDPAPFLHALASARKRSNLGSADVQVDLVGNCRWYLGTSVEHLVQSLGLTDWVRFHDWVPHQEAQEFVRSADMLLLLAQGQPDQVPNKLYEYLGTRKPIFAMIDEQGETSDMIRQVGGHFAVTGISLPETEAALERALHRNWPERSPHADAILQDWTTDSQMGNLTRLLERMAGAHH